MTFNGACRALFSVNIPIHLIDAEMIVLYIVTIYITVFLMK